MRHSYSLFISSQGEIIKSRKAVYFGREPIAEVETKEIYIEIKVPGLKEGFSIIMDSCL